MRVSAAADADAPLALSATPQVLFTSALSLTGQVSEDEYDKQSGAAPLTSTNSQSCAGMEAGREREGGRSLPSQPCVRLTVPCRAGTPCAPRSPHRRQQGAARSGPAFPCPLLTPFARAPLPSVALPDLA